MIALSGWVIACTPAGGGSGRAKGTGLPPPPPNGCRPLTPHSEYHMFCIVLSAIFVGFGGVGKKFCGGLKWFLMAFLLFVFVI